MGAGMLVRGHGCRIAVSVLLLVAVLLVPRFLWNGNVSIQGFVNLKVPKKYCQSIIEVLLDGRCICRPGMRRYGLAAG
jgi:hypothetical protein